MDSNSIKSISKEILENPNGPQDPSSDANQRLEKAVISAFQNARVPSDYQKVLDEMGEVYQLAYGQVVEFCKEHNVSIEQYKKAFTEEIEKEPTLRALVKSTVKPVLETPKEIDLSQKKTSKRKRFLKRNRQNFV